MISLLLCIFVSFAMRSENYLHFPLTHALGGASVLVGSDRAHSQAVTITGIDIHGLIHLLIYATQLMWAPVVGHLRSAMHLLPLN